MLNNPVEFFLFFLFFLPVVLWTNVLISRPGMCIKSQVTWHIFLPTVGNVSTQWLNPQKRFVSTAHTQIKNGGSVFHKISKYCCLQLQIDLEVLTEFSHAYAWHASTVWCLFWLGQCGVINERKLPHVTNSSLHVANLIYSKIGHVHACNSVYTTLFEEVDDFNTWSTEHLLLLWKLVADRAVIIEGDPLLCHPFCQLRVTLIWIPAAYQ